MHVRQPGLLALQNPKAPIRICLGFAAKHMHSVQSDMTAQDTQRVPSWADGHRGAEHGAWPALPTENTLGLPTHRDCPNASHHAFVLLRTVLSGTSLHSAMVRSTAGYSCAVFESKPVRPKCRTTLTMQSRDLIPCERFCRRGKKKPTLSCLRHRLKVAILCVSSLLGELRAFQNNLQSTNS